MIDLHSHIIPTVDDGSKSIEETFNLIKEAQRAGFDKIVCTSHYMEGYYEANRKERETWVNALNDALVKENIKVKLYLGTETYFTEDIMDLLEDEKATTINDSSYILFETALNSKPLSLQDVIFKMQKYKLIPIFAHPERYSYIQQNPELLYELFRMGVLFQVNYGSILGQYGEKAKLIVTKMFKANMVHFIGTDVHRQKTVYEKVPYALQEIEKIIDAAKIDELVNVNPELVLNNKKVDVSEPLEMKFNFLEKRILSKNEKNVK